MRGVDLERLRHDWLEHLPLVEPQAIHHDEEHRRVLGEHGEEELADDVHGERRAVAVEFMHPARVSLADVRGEVLVHRGKEGAQGRVEPMLAGGGEVDIPLHQFGIAFGPAAPVEVLEAYRLQFAEPFHELPGDGLAADPRPLEDPRDDAQHLPWSDRLHQVLRDVLAERLAQGAVLLALGDHDHWQRGGEFARLAHHGDAPHARHLFVEEQDVEGVLTQQLEGVGRVAGHLHAIPFLGQEQSVRLEEFSLVVHPEHGLRRQRHILRKLVPANSRRQRRLCWRCAMGCRRFGGDMDDKPSFALAESRFPLRALAAAAARAPLGGAREALTATLVAARLAAVAHGPGALPVALRAARAAAARHWMGALTLPAPVRSALVQLVEASTRGSRQPCRPPSPR